MSSTIFYRFKSQNSTSRVLFDGTGITVFDLKKEIINENKLAPGTDFDLRLYNSDSMDEYQDDTVVIPRSTSVVARRSPASRHGKGSAARYVTGKAKIAKIDLKSSNTNNSNANAASNSNTTDGDKKMTEEERISQMFAAQGDQWKQTQQQMSSATPVYNKQQASSGNPDDVPPPGYMCYRCGSKDHWIKNCPTNDDPNWEGKRVKRTTGIPKSYLKTIEKPDDDDSGTKSYMMNEEGKYVIQIADEKSWENYKKKANKTHDIINELKELDPELIDPINNKIFDDPVTTPCCEKNYSRNTIEEALLESDFVCPKCGKSDIFLDQLKPNKELSEKIDQVLDEEFEKRGLKRNLNEDDGAHKRQDIGSLPIRPQQQFPQPIMPIPPFGLPFVQPFGIIPQTQPPTSK